MSESPTHDLRLTGLTVIVSGPNYGIKKVHGRLGRKWPFLMLRHCIHAIRFSYLEIAVALVSLQADMVLLTSCQSPG